MIFPSIYETILLFIAGVGTIQAIFLVTLLFVHPKSDLSVNRFLALYIILLTLPMVMPVLQMFSSWQILILIEPFLTLIPPLLLFYVRSFKESITWKKAWPHLVFFFVCVAIAFWNFFIEGSKYPGTPTKEATQNFMILLPLLIRIVQRLVYYFICRRALNSYQYSIKLLFSETSRIDLNWMRWLINGFLLLIFVSMVAYILLIKFPEQFGLWLLVSALFVSCYIYMATIKGVTQSTLWQLNADVSKENLEQVIEEVTRVDSQDIVTEKTGPRKGGLSIMKIEEILSRVTHLMEIEKLYQEPELTLQQLATKLQFAPHHVSQAINDGMNKNFYDLVNSYRVEEAKRLLLDARSKNYTILSVGFEAGFNSKTTFNTVFKKFTGLTPSEFRNEEKVKIREAKS